MELPRLLSQRRLALCARLVANGAAQAGTVVATALLVQAAFDRFVTDAAGLTPLATAGLAAGLVLTALCLAWLRTAELTDAEQLGQGYVTDVRLALYRRLVTLPPRALEGRSQGGVLLRFVGDLTAIRQWVTLGLARLVVAGVTTTGALTALAFLSWRIAGAVGIALVPGTAASLWLGPRMRSVAREARKMRSRLAANVNEKVGVVAVVQAFGQVAREERRLAGQSARLRNAMVERARVIGQLRAVTEATTALAAGAALLLGAHEVAAGRASPGTVVAAMTIVGVLVPPLRDLGRAHEYWQQARVSRTHLLTFLRLPGYADELAGAPALAAAAGRIELVGLSVRGSLEDISATAEGGSFVAVVGPNGAGKSTLLAAIARLVETDRGAVYLDGENVAQRDLASVRRAVGLVGPDLPLLRGSVEKNLRYRWPDATPEEIVRVLRLCDLDELLGELPEGLGTRVGEGGKGLSTGQRQRIALARALVGDPSVLLLDEVDAHLDADATALVDKVIARRRATVLVATHRLECVFGADLLWHLEDGRLVAAGPPSELLGSGGPTDRLFRSDPALRGRLAL